MSVGTPALVGEAKGAAVAHVTDIPLRLMFGDLELVGTSIPVTGRARGAHIFLTVNHDDIEAAARSLVQQLSRQEVGDGRPDT